MDEQMKNSMAKAFALILCMTVLLVCMGGAAMAEVTPPSDMEERGANKGFSSNWKYWMQGASSNYNMRKYGFESLQKIKRLWK